MLSVPVLFVLFVPTLVLSEPVSRILKIGCIPTSISYKPDAGNYHKTAIKRSRNMFFIWLNDWNSIFHIDNKNWMSCMLMITLDRTVSQLWIHSDTLKVFMTFSRVNRYRRREILEAVWKSPYLYVTYCICRPQNRHLTP